MYFSVNNGNWLAADLKRMLTFRTDLMYCNSVYAIYDINTNKENTHLWITH